MFSLLDRLVGWFAKYLPERYRPAQQPEKSVESIANSVPKPLSNGKLGTEEIEREIRAGRKFSLAEAIGREGGGFMKGESAIPRPLRAANEIKQFITTFSPDPAGVLASELTLWATSDAGVSRQLDTPLVALAQIVDSLLAEPTVFYEFARRVAIAQSKLTGDRPYFQQLDQPAHPDADYTHHNIRQYLLDISNYLRDSLEDHA